MTLHIDIITLLWTLGGFLGGIVRWLLFMKFRDDLRWVVHAGLGIDAKAIAKIALFSTKIHITINVGILAIGFAAMFLPQNNQTPAAGSVAFYAAIVTTVIVTIPWLLCVDAVRQYQHQLWLLRKVEGVERDSAKP